MNVFNKFVAFLLNLAYVSQYYDLLYMHFPCSKPFPKVFFKTAVFDSANSSSDMTFLKCLTLTLKFLQTLSGYISSFTEYFYCPAIFRLFSRAILDCTQFGANFASEKFEKNFSFIFKNNSQKIIIREL